MGNITSASTLYSKAYLTKKGRELLFNKNNIRYNSNGDDLLKPEFFSMSDVDVNYNILEGNNLKSGQVPDISGTHFSSIKGVWDKDLRNLVYVNSNSINNSSVPNLSISYNGSDETLSLQNKNAFEFGKTVYDDTVNPYDFINYGTTNDNLIFNLNVPETELNEPILLTNNSSKVYNFQQIDYEYSQNLSDITGNQFVRNLSCKTQDIKSNTSIIENYNIYLTNFELLNIYTNRFVLPINTKIRDVNYTNGLDLFLKIYYPDNINYDNSFGATLCYKYPTDQNKIDDGYLNLISGTYSSLSLDNVNAIISWAEKDRIPPLSTEIRKKVLKFSFFGQKTNRPSQSKTFSVSFVYKIIV